MKITTVEHVDSVFQLERKLAQKGRRIARVSREEIYPECTEIERLPIVAKDSDGNTWEWLFAWGRLIRREPLFSRATTMVAIIEETGAVEIGAGAPFEP